MVSVPSLSQLLSAVLVALSLTPLPAAGQEKDPFFLWYTLGELDLDTGNMSDELKALDGKAVDVAGYVVPTEFDGAGTVKEFILVPAFGYCIHVPPPPPNQMVYVTMKEKTTFEDLWLPVVVHGTLSLKAVESEFGDVSFGLSGEKIVKYDDRNYQ